MSKLKAELVRNNIVTRANLMKLYQPPKAVKMPTQHQNPFYNGEIVTQSQVSQHSSRFLEKEARKSSAAANLFGKQSVGYKTVTSSDGVSPFTVGRTNRRSSHGLDTKNKLRNKKNSGP